MHVSIKFGGGFTELGQLCKRLLLAYRRTDYQRDFSWVDHVKMVREANLRDALLEKLVGDLLGDFENLSFVPTILLDWKEVSSFRISRVPGETIEAENPEDLLPAFIERLTDRSSLQDLNVSKLKQYRFESINGDGDLSGSATLLASIEGELDFEGEQYLVSEGDFFKVQENYLSELNQFVDDISVFSGTLPSSLDGEHEGDYNERAANSSTSYLNLDKQTVRIPGKTTAIEICDVLTRTKEFIHVKRKLSSSNLSHLFAQGAVSADLFLMSSEFRSLTQEKIGEASQERNTREPDFDTNFMPFDIDQPIPRQCEVVYAIIAKWNGKEFSEAIPFFSKVNLRRIGQELKRMGYRYSLCKIEVE